MGFIWYYYPDRREIYVPDSNLVIYGIESFEEAKRFFDNDDIEWTNYWTRL